MKTKLISIILSLVLTSNLFAISYPATSGFYGNSHYTIQSSWRYATLQSSQVSIYPYVYNGIYYSATILGADPVYADTFDAYLATFVPDSSYPTCSTGQIYNTSGTCTTCSSPNVVDPVQNLCTTPDALCTASGGVMQSDGTCLNKVQAANSTLNSVTARIGAGIFLSGVMITAAGLVPTPFSPALLATGLTAMIPGTLSSFFWYSNNTNLDVGSSTSPSNTVTVDLSTFKESTNPSTGDTQVTKTDNSSGKVTEATIVPEKVVQNLENGQPQMVNNAGAGQPLPPVDLTGTTHTTYDYPNNTATTQTVNPDQTITTTTTPIVVTNNPDGSTTAAPSTPNSSVPVVNSGGGGQVVNKTPGTAQLGGGVQGGASLDDIYNQLHMGGDPAGTLQGTPDNGLDKANSLMGDVQNSFTSFQMVDPLGLSAVAPPIDTISLDLYGHHFVVFDQNTLNQLPLAMIRSLLLFIAALIGLQNVLTGGM
ncbi:hypothetical protein [Sulfuricurvum sp.]|uniref:hypothetical protein n=1 Tax=Sulfuricurvum sp. TaxID=2025608 RepID=UPI0035669C19